MKTEISGSAQVSHFAPGYLTSRFNVQVKLNLIYRGNQVKNGKLYSLPNTWFKHFNSKILVLTNF